MASRIDNKINDRSAHRTKKNSTFLSSFDDLIFRMFRHLRYLFDFLLTGLFAARPQLCDAENRFLNSERRFSGAMCDGIDSNCRIHDIYMVISRKMVKKNPNFCGGREQSLRGINPPKLSEGFLRA